MATEQDPELRHKRQVLAEQVAITRAVALIAPTRASLLAYARAELARLELDAPDDADELPF